MPDPYSIVNGVRNESAGNEFDVFRIRGFFGMKNINIFILALVLFPASVRGQTTHNSNSKTDSVTKSVQGPQILLISQMDQRKIYHWNNGQRSTPTGREAGEAAITYVKVIGDSAVVLGDPNDEAKKSAKNSMASFKISH